MILLFGMGFMLAFFYTAKPLGLKYLALGDVVIILAFGPVVQQFVCLMLTGHFRPQILPFCIPIALLTEAILHANNSRDIQSDSEAGVTTLSTLLGFKASYIIYAAIYIVTYISIPLLAHAWKMNGLYVTFLTMPSALKLVSKFGTDIETLDQESAQFHSLFGISMLIGIISGY